ncbi:rhoGAP domain-containing protein [Phthorimaea operculella]|nr:rhoGAP domain-containing protein [Phthorimaea operculella]
MNEDTRKASIRRRKHSPASSSQSAGRQLGATGNIHTILYSKHKHERRHKEGKHKEKKNAAPPAAANQQAANWGPQQADSTSKNERRHKDGKHKKKKNTAAPAAANQQAANWGPQVINIQYCIASISSSKHERRHKEKKNTAPPAAANQHAANWGPQGAHGVPLFIEKCVEFIEREGLASEGLYRVPGNRAHVEMLFNKFYEDPNVDLDTLDIPVNAVATALKDFFSKKLPPLLDEASMAQLEDIAAMRGSTMAGGVELKDRSWRLLALRQLLNTALTPVARATLDYVLDHFSRVADNSKLNSMDSKNLSICWWPTLLPVQFSDMGRFEMCRPYLEDIVQTMIDQHPFLFRGREAFVMVGRQTGPPVGQMEDIVQTMIDQHPFLFRGREAFVMV